MKKTGWEKRAFALLLSGTVMLSGCGFGSLQEYYEELESAVHELQEQVESKAEENRAEKEEAKPQTAAKEDKPETSTALSAAGGEEEIFYDPDLVPCVRPYQVEEKLANVTWAPAFDYMFAPGSYEEEAYLPLREKLEEQGFAVSNSKEDEFYEIYEDNRYVMFPSFITVDSLMHTYHLYFGHLMRTTEKTYLAGNLKTLSSAMLKETGAQYEICKGTDWEQAALRNLIFFRVGARLLDVDTAGTSEGDAGQAAQEEYDRIMKAEGIAICSLTGEYEDYSQYLPRGYYEGDPELESYFRAMMWYGRIPFVFEQEDQIRSALLMTTAIEKAGKLEWEGIYQVTSFFAGASDDPGYEEIRGVLESCYGSLPDTEKLTADTASFEKALQACKELRLPAIHSIPVEDGMDPVIPSYRFMGQRYTVDADIMQRLIYSSVRENPAGEKRMLPDVLDSAAALGSDEALRILEAQGDTEYQNYTDNLTLMRDHFADAGSNVWNASLYAGWLNTLRPLLEQKGEGYPYYMQSEAWTRKNLETYAGSYAELKHDTILYAKQVMAEMGGGGDDEILDDRGYVDPQPVVYSRFAELAKRTREGLLTYGMLTDTAGEDLNKLYEIAMTLLTISEKELKNEMPSEEEFEFIRCYGGYLEHFWQEANRDKSETLTYGYQAPCPVVADIATDPNGTVLEVASGSANVMYVVFPVGEELHIGRGSVYSFYQFTRPLSERMKDSEWIAVMNGGYIDDNWQWVQAEEAPPQPDWTQGYSFTYGW